MGVAVIATGIAGAIGWALLYFAGWWPSVLGAGDAALAFMIGSSSVSNWLLALLWLCALAVGVVVALILWNVVFRREAQQVLDFKNYAQDDFFGLRWRWRYDGNDTYNIVPFCPGCDYQLEPRPTGYSVADVIVFHCDACRVDICEFEFGWSELESRVRRKIHQALRNGMWPETVQRTLRSREKTQSFNSEA